MMKKRNGRLLAGALCLSLIGAGIAWQAPCEMGKIVSADESEQEMAEQSLEIGWKLKEEGSQTVILTAANSDMSGKEQKLRINLFEEENGENTHTMAKAVITNMDKARDENVSSLVGKIVLTGADTLELLEHEDEVNRYLEITIPAGTMVTAELDFALEEGESIRMQPQLVDGFFYEDLPAAVSLSEEGISGEGVMPQLAVKPDETEETTEEADAEEVGEEETTGEADGEGLAEEDTTEEADGEGLMEEETTEADGEGLAENETTEEDGAELYSDEEAEEPAKFRGVSAIRTHMFASEEEWNAYLTDLADANKKKAEEKKAAKEAEETPETTAETEDTETEENTEEEAADQSDAVLEIQSEEGSAFMAVEIANASGSALRDLVVIRKTAGTEYQAITGVLNRQNKIQSEGILKDEGSSRLVILKADGTVEELEEGKDYEVGFGAESIYTEEDWNGKKVWDGEESESDAVRICLSAKTVLKNGDSLWIVTEVSAQGLTDENAGAYQTAGFAGVWEDSLVYLEGEYAGIKKAAAPEETTEEETTAEVTEEETTEEATEEETTEEVTEEETTEEVTEEETTEVETEAETTEEETESPVIPITEAPVTEAPATEAPTTEAPTEAPTTAVPATEAPTTEAPTTEAPTEAPVAAVPATEAPTTEAPTTEAATTEAITEAPTTEAPTTEAPATEAPTTESITEVPTTEAPTTEAPTTIEETTIVSKGANTNDNHKIMLWVILGVAALGGLLIGVSIFRSKKR